jgi:hypothetical protein
MAGDKVMWLLLPLAIVLSCSTGRSRPEVDQQPESPVACYRLQVWPDASGAEAEELRAGWHFPPFLQLLDEPLEGWPSMQETYGEVFSARCFDESGTPLSHPFNYWRTDGDSIHAGHPGALAGLQLTLARKGADLEGWMRAFTDVWEEGKPSAEKVPVRAVQVECPGTGGR